MFLDGTKLESRAGRYTFVWRKSVEKQLARVKEKLKTLTGLTTSAAVRSLLEEEAGEIVFVRGTGRRKSRAQWEYEEKQALLERLERYEDMMRDGQLKPGYNVQIAVNSEYITGIEAFSDRTDVRTLRPMLEKLSQWHQARYEEVVADAGYESLENYLYLEQNGQMCFIKPTNYDQKRTKKFQKQVGRIENMAYDPEGDHFTCAQGRKLHLRRESTEVQGGQLVSTAWYRCEDCSECPCRVQCCRAKDLDRPKEIILKKTFWEKREQAEKNIRTERGIHLRLCRSIQVEGAFGLLKNDFGFRRFLTRGKANIRTELFLPALAFDLKKLWMKREQGRLQTRVSMKMIS